MKASAALPFIVLAFFAASAAACSSCGTSRFPTPSACVVSGTTVDPKAEGCCADIEAVTLLGRILDELGGSAYEATKATVDKGNSPFGAAILSNEGPGYPLLYADANQVQTAKTPTAHGEISTINGFFQTVPDAQRLPAADTIFLATHQPCSLCMSGLAFAGFRRVFYAFDYEMSINGGGDAGDILDAVVIEEVFTASCGHVDHTNGMFTMIPVQAALQMLPCGNDKSIAAALRSEQQRFDNIKEKYAELGRVFQERMAAAGSGGSGIQLLAKACVGCKPYPRQECVRPGYDPNADASTAAAGKEEL